MNAQEIIDYIASSPKKTPVKIYVNLTAPVDFGSAQVFGQGALAGQPLAHRQRAGEYVPAQAAVQVFVYRRATALREVIGQHIAPLVLLKKSKVSISIIPQLA